MWYSILSRSNLCSSEDIMDNFNSNQIEPVNDDLFAESESQPVVDNLIEAITTGQYVVAAAVVEGEKELAHDEYEDVTIDFENRIDLTVAVIRGSRESLGSLWTMFALYGKSLNDKMEAGIDEDDEIPVMAIRIYPVDGEAPDNSYIELALPAVYAFSSDGYGLPGDHIVAAFPSDFCNVYQDEPVDEAEAAVEETYSFNFFDQ